MYTFYSIYITKKWLVEKVYGIKPRSCISCKKKVAPILNPPISSLKDKKNCQVLKTEIKPEEEELLEVPPEVSKEAYSTIEGTLDIVSLCRQMYTLSLLTNLLLKDYQTNLSPLMALLKPLAKEVTGLKPRKSVRAKTAENGHRLSDAIAKLQASVKLGVKKRSPSPIMDPLHQSLDRMCWQSLHSLGCVPGDDGASRPMLQPLRLIRSTLKSERSRTWNEELSKPKTDI